MTSSELNEEVQQLHESLGEGLKALASRMFSFQAQLDLVTKQRDDALRERDKAKRQLDAVLAGLSHLPSSDLEFLRNQF